MSLELQDAEHLLNYTNDAFEALTDEQFENLSYEARTWYRHAAALAFHLEKAVGEIKSARKKGTSCPQQVTQSETSTPRLTPTS